MKKHITYKTSGTCSRAIEVYLTDDGKIENVTFYGGCSGNTTGISMLVAGMDAEEAISKLSGIRCGFKNTSCPDQLAKALRIALDAEDTEE